MNKVKDKLQQHRLNRNRSLIEDVDFLLNLVYEIRLNLCWPSEDDSSSSMVNEFMETKKLSAGDKHLRLKSIWESTTEMLQVLNKG